MAPPPSIEERLCAAAHRILTDGRRHRADAMFWAYDFLQQSARGRTEFTRQAQRRLPSNSHRRNHVPA
ncbi:MAG: hypothetical protein JWQ03_1635 [Variovorax sp.]|nr:hypothetical protein [Variovorax sp.]